MKRLGSRWRQLADRTGFRWAVSGLLGLSVFLLGVAYLSLEDEPRAPSLQVLGGAQVRAGMPAAVRVRARVAGSSAPLAVRVTDVRVDGRPAAVGVRGEDPAIVRFSVPAGAGDQVTLALTAEAAARRERLEIPLPVVHSDATAGAVPRTPEPRGEVATAHRVEVRPEAGALAANMDNRLLVRVLDVDGEPVAGARVTVSHATLPGGRVVARTDGRGLAALRLDARQPSFRLGLVVEDGAGRRTATEALLRPAGRQMLLRLTPPAVTPGQPVRPTLLTWEADATLFCDLLMGDAWVWSDRVQSDHGRAELDLGPLEPGRYDLQCYRHAVEPGEAYATLPIVVSPLPPAQALRDEARRTGLGDPAPSDPAPDRESPAAPDRESPAAARGDDRESLEAAWWQAVLRPEPRSPALLASTRAGDEAARRAEHDRKKTRLLVALGAVFLVVLLWTAEAILKLLLDRRDRLRRYAIELMVDGDVEVDVDELSPAAFHERDTLVRARSALLALVLVGAIALNIIGLLGLFALIK